METPVDRLAGETQSGVSTAPPAPAVEECGRVPAVVEPVMPFPEQLVLCGVPSEAIRGQPKLGRAGCTPLSLGG